MASSRLGQPQAQSGQPRAGQEVTSIPSPLNPLPYGLLLSLRSANSSL